MPVYRLTASSIISSFRVSGKRHLLLTGGRGTGKTTLLRALVPLLCPEAQEITTAAYPADRVEIRESVGGKIAVIGRFDPALPPGENRMRPVADGFLLLGVPALHRMAAGESEWAVLDELGYLENSCPEFRQAVEALLDAKRVLAIVRKQDTPFLTALRARQDAFVVDLDDPAPALGCVVMASGLGRRFGGNKLLADFCGAPLIANALALAALPLLAQKPGCDAAILDVMLPGMNGFSLCETIRRTDQKIGIIILSAKGQEQDKIRGLSIGADDYMTKPFSVSELLGRVEALCRRVGRSGSGSAADENAPTTLVSGEFVLDENRRVLLKAGRQIELTQVEFQIMELFFHNPGIALVREKILKGVWGENYFGDVKIVDVNIRRLRMKVEDEPSHPTHIMTVWGYGYRWEE